MGRVWATVWRTGVKYVETDGEQYAASFAYYALFSLLPLLVLLITAGTRFLGNREQATTQIFELLSQYIVDLGSAETVRATVQSFMQSRLGSGLISFAILTWCSLRFFHSLVRAVNNAWGTHELSWWRLPLKNLLMVTVLASALLIGLIAPAILNGLEKYYLSHPAVFSFDFAFLQPRAFLQVCAAAEDDVPRGVDRGVPRHGGARRPAKAVHLLRRAGGAFQRGVRRLRQRGGAAAVDLSHGHGDHHRRLPERGARRGGGGEIRSIFPGQLVIHKGFTLDGANTALAVDVDSALTVTRSKNAHHRPSDPGSPRRG